MLDGEVTHICRLNVCGCNSITLLENGAGSRQLDWNYEGRDSPPQPTMKTTGNDPRDEW